jgi:uncharacterized membrane protein
MNQKRKPKPKKKIINKHNPINSPTPVLVEDNTNDAVSRIGQPIKAIGHENEKVHAVINSSFQGPLPHPDIFKRYSETIPDAPERILRQFEEDSHHIRDMQAKALEAQKQDNRRVHWMAWSLIIGGYLLSIYFASVDKDWLSGIILATTLGGTIIGFLQNKVRPNDKNDSE